MAEALKLFNFRAPSNATELSIPEQVKPKKRKRGKDIATVAKGELVSYWCCNCQRVVDIATTAALQCGHCNTRFVEKLRSKKEISYSAI